MERTTLWRLVIGLWVALALVFLIMAIIVFHDNPVRDGKPYDGAESLLTLFMLVLSFPSGWIGMGMARLIQMIANAVTGEAIALSYAWLTVQWLLFVLAGYVQWFVLVPWLWRKWKASRSGALV